MLETHQRRTNGEEFVTRHRTVMGGIKIAEFPDGSPRPLLVQLCLNVANLVSELLVQLLSVCELLHDVEKPLPHSTREVDHFFLGTCLKLNERGNVVNVARECSSFCNLINRKI